MRWRPSGPARPGPYTYVWLDGMVEKVREDRWIQNVAVVTATGVNAAGHREVLGLEVITTEDGPDGCLPAGPGCPRVERHRTRDLRCPPVPRRPCGLHFGIDLAGVPHPLHA